MKTKFWLSFITLIGLFSTNQAAQSQTYQPSNRAPVSDSTLGTQVSGTGSNFNITGGVNKGQTLFHSFTDFSVPTNGQANFTNPVGNRDIITRVTGNLFSDINGTVNSNGANFFLINPNGIVFGTDARLNVGKAFVGSTANSIDLVGGGQTITFGTNPSGDAPLLSVAPNVLFDVSRLNLGGGSGAISSFGTLQTQYIGLIGGKVAIDGGRISTFGGRVELGGLSAPGSIEIATDGSTPKLNFPANVTRSDVSITNAAVINTLGFGGGDIFVTARNFEILGSSLKAGILLGLGPIDVAGDIKLDATGTIFVNSSSITNQLESTANGKGGNITINANSLSVSNASTIANDTLGRGNAGNITIVGAKNINLANSGIFSTNDGGIGNAGNIDIKTTGDLTIDGNDRSVALLDGADATRVKNSSSISSNSSGKGDSGKITIDTQGNVSLNDRAFISSEIRGAEGNSQEISINTKNLSVTNNSAISTANQNSIGNAGNINIKTTGDIKIAGLTDLSFENKQGLNSSSIITTNLGGIGNSGNIKIESKGNIGLSNALISSFSSGEGQAANISISSQKLNLSNLSFIATDGFSVGGGNITLAISDLLLLRNTSSISSKSRSAGEDGNGGNITISSPLIVAVPGNNDITANAVQGTGGNVRITSQGLFGIQFRPTGSEFASDITASSTFGQDGTVNITTPGTDPGRDSTELPNTTPDASNQISQVCSTNNRQNKLTVTGRGGLPPNANDPLTSDVVWQDARAASPQPVASSATNNPTKLIPPAVGWVSDSKGKVTLIAAGTQGQRTGTSVVCPSNK